MINPDARPPRSAAVLEGLLSPAQRALLDLAHRGNAATRPKFHVVWAERADPPLAAAEYLDRGALENELRQVQRGGAGGGARGERWRGGGGQRWGRGTERRDVERQRQAGIGQGREEWRGPAGGRPARSPRRLHSRDGEDGAAAGA